MIKSIGILGGGFGLYGYLPAAIENSYQVSTLLRYSDTIKDREPLRDFHPKINFLKNEQELLDVCNYIVVARNPFSQFEFLFRHSESIKNKSHLFLEKPLSDSAENSRAALNFLRDNSINFSVGYLFSYCSWYSDILNMSATNNNSLFLLTWRIPKPPENSWKSNESFGGGIFHFYCIHFIKFALDLEVKIEDINIDSLENYLYFFFTSKGNSYSLKLFLTDNSPNFLVTVKLDQKETIIYENSTPFGSGTNRLLKDPRVPYLRKYLHSRIDNSTTICKDLEIEEAAIYLIKKYYNH